MSALLNMYYSVTRKPFDHWLGYTVAVSGALMQMMTYGIDNSFAIFASDMEADASLGNPSATAVSFGNSVSLGLSPVFGVFAGFLVDRVPPRFMMLLSTLLLFLGEWICSTWANSMVAVTFSYCILASISSACMLSPGAAATGSWFNKRLGLAQGINFCGGGIGSAVIAPILGNWADMYGWRKTFRLMSVFCVIGLFASIFSCRRGEPNDEDDEVSSGTEEVHAGVDVPKKSVQPRGGSPVRNGEAVEPTMYADDVAEQGSGHSLPAEEGSEENTTPTSAEAAAARDVYAGGDDALDDAVLPSQMEEELPRRALTRHEALMEAVHTRRLSPVEVLRVLITREFLANFFMFAIYGWAFYGMIYGAVPYVSSMGKEGTVYQHLTPISTAKASTVLTFWGSFQIVGSVLIGALASATTDYFAYCVCCAVGGITAALLAFCRTYAAFAACMSIIGFCTAGIFAVMPALIVKYFYGPNLGFFMACVFVAGCLGGFSAPPIQAQLQTTHQGNYSYGCIFISCCLTVPGLICYAFLWPNKRNKAVRAVERGAGKLVNNLSCCS